jgi:uncharacterized membrane protein
VKPTHLLTTSALFCFVLALACLFAPAEIAKASGSALGSDSASTALALQLLGAAVFGLAMLNWMTRQTAIGGIYGRPVVIANLVHFNTGFLTLIKAALAADDGLLLGCAAGIYGVLALAFWSRLLGRGATG